VVNRRLLILIIICLSIGKLSFAEEPVVGVKSEGQVKALSILEISSSGQSGKSAPDHLQNQASIGDINLTYGTVQFSEGDLSFPGKNGLDLLIGRTYASKKYLSNATLNMTYPNTWGGWAGHGWSFSFAQRAYVLWSTEVSQRKIVIDSQGDLMEFKYNTTRNDFESTMPGVFSRATFSETADGVITVMDNTGKRYVFEKRFYLEPLINKTGFVKGYYLSKISDLYANEIKIDYEAVPNGIDNTQYQPENRLGYILGTPSYNITANPVPFYYMVKTGRQMNEGVGNNFYIYINQHVVNGYIEDKKMVLINKYYISNNNGQEVYPNILSNYVICGGYKKEGWWSTDFGSETYFYWNNQNVYVAKKYDTVGGKGHDQNFSLYFERVPYFEIYIMNRDKTEINYSFAKKSNGKFYIYPDNVEQDSVAFNNIVNSIISKLAVNSLLNPENSELANTLIAFNAKNFDYFLNNNTQYSGGIAKANYYRPNKLTDTWGNNYLLSYNSPGQNTAVSDDVKNVQVTQILYKNTNGDTNTHKYYYDASGSVSKVVANSQVMSEYTYRYYEPSYKYYFATNFNSFAPANYYGESYYYAYENTQDLNGWPRTIMADNIIQQLKGMVMLSDYGK